MVDINRIRHGDTIEVVFDPPILKNRQVISRARGLAQVVAGLRCVVDDENRTGTGTGIPIVITLREDRIADFVILSRAETPPIVEGGLT